MINSNVRSSQNLSDESSKQADNSMFQISACLNFSASTRIPGLTSKPTSAPSKCSFLETSQPFQCRLEVAIVPFRSSRPIAMCLPIPCFIHGRGKSKNGLVGLNMLPGYVQAYSIVNKKIVPIHIPVKLKCYMARFTAEKATFWLKVIETNLSDLALLTFSGSVPVVRNLLLTF